MSYKIILALFILHLTFYSFFTYVDNEIREWMMIVICKKREIITKIKKILYFNEI